MLKKMVLTLLLLTFTAVTAFSLPLPWLDYSGSASFDSYQLTGYQVRAYSVTYEDGANNNSYSASPDSILGSMVEIGQPVFIGLVSGNYTFADTTFSLTALNGEVVFTADLIDIVYNPAGGSSGTVNLGYSANLQNVNINNTIDSLYLEQMSAAVISAEYQAATSATFAFNPSLTELFDTGTGTVNVNGKIAPVPEPGTLLLLGSGLVGLAFLKRRKS